jgi:hypothetical protein
MDDTACSATLPASSYAARASPAAEAMRLPSTTLRTTKTSVNGRPASASFHAKTKDTTSAPKKSVMLAKTFCSCKHGTGEEGEQQIQKTRVSRCMRVQGEIKTFSARKSWIA